MTDEQLQQYQAELVEAALRGDMRRCWGYGSSYCGRLFARYVQIWHVGELCPLCAIKALSTYGGYSEETKQAHIAQLAGIARRQELIIRCPTCQQLVTRPRR